MRKMPEFSGTVIYAGVLYSLMWEAIIAVSAITVFTMTWHKKTARLYIAQVFPALIQKIAIFH